MRHQGYWFIQAHKIKLRIFLVYYNRMLSILRRHWFRIQRLPREFAAHRQRYFENHDSSVYGTRSKFLEKQGFISKLYGEMLWNKKGGIGLKRSRFCSGRSEVLILSRLTRMQCCQQLATSATFLGKELCCPGGIITKCTVFLVLRFAISQAGIAARTLTLMQGSEEKE